jgi:hypothetical protein
MEMIKLEVGSVLYTSHRLSNSMQKYVIDRVTEKTAFCDKHYVSFKREGSDYFIAKGDSSSYNRTHYYLATPKLDAEYEAHYTKAKLMKAWEEFIKSNPSTDRMVEVYQAITCKLYISSGADK